MIDNLIDLGMNSSVCPVYPDESFGDIRHSVMEMEMRAMGHSRSVQKAGGRMVLYAPINRNA